MVWNEAQIFFTMNNLSHQTSSKQFLLSEKFKIYFASLNSVTTCNQVSSVLTFQDNIPDAMLKKLKKYIDNPKFTPENVEKVSKVN